MSFKKPSSRALAQNGQSRARLKAVLVAGTGVVLVLLLGFMRWQSVSAPVRQHPALSHESEVRTLVEVDDAAYRQQFGTNLAVADPRRVMAQGASGADLASHYQTYFRYPHNSRPLNSDMHSLLEPLRMQTSPKPVYTQERRTGSEHPQYYVQFFASRQAIIGDETFRATLHVENAESGVAILPTIKKAVVLSDLKTGRVELGVAEQIEPDSTEQGAQGFAWRAPAKSRLYWGELELAVELDIEGVEVVQRLPFSSTPAAPASFTGKFSEELVDGSLVMNAEVAVTESGSYVFEGSLYHQDTDAPVSWSRNLVTLQAGTHQVKYLFFGRIFHDKQLSGAFALRHLRGYRLNRAYDPGAMADPRRFAQQQKEQTPEQQEKSREVADEPLHQFVAVWPTDVVSERYELTDFSSAEYEGPDKDRTLDALVVNGVAP